MHATTENLLINGQAHIRQPDEYITYYQPHLFIEQFPQ
jgi:hypothetical protein